MGSGAVPVPHPKNLLRMQFRLGELAKQGLLPGFRTRFFLEYLE